MSTAFRLLLPRAIYDEMLRQAQAERPNECCGLLAGRIADGLARVEARYPLVNELATPTTYRSEPRSILAAYRDIDRRELELVAVYHSHPTTPPRPSRTDLENNYLGETVMHFIVSLASEPPSVAAWWLESHNSRPAEWTIDPNA